MGGEPTSTEAAVKGEVARFQTFSPSTRNGEFDLQ
jgi:hypothetical protein